jgi:molecular chaperone GrpE
MEDIREDNVQQEEPAEDDIVEAEETEEKEFTAEEELVLMQQELADARDMMLRLAAEMDNYKKRTEKERSSLIKYASQSIIQELISILDNFERAIESANKSRDFDSFLEGVELIFRQMCDALERKGVSQIEALGKPFDPNIHEAIAQVPTEECPENTVVEELQKGYMLHDRVIRPSRVAVSCGLKE